MTRSLLAALALTAASTTVCMAEEIKIFGLPLDGKLGYRIKECPPSFPPTKLICWVGRPFVGKTGVLGSAKLPDAGLPEWAAYTTQKIELRHDGTLERIEISGVENDKQDEVVASISRRFGTPRTLSRYPVGNLYGWRKPEVEINMTCPTGSPCSMTFASASAAREAAESAAAAERARLARPLSP